MRDLLKPEIFGARENCKLTQPNNEELRGCTTPLSSYAKRMRARDLYTQNTAATQTGCHIAHSIINLV